MDGLAQDLNSALEESTASSSHKRKSWKRRCRSTTSLANAGSSPSSTHRINASKNHRHRRKKRGGVYNASSTCESSSSSEANTLQIENSGLILGDSDQEIKSVFKNPSILTGMDAHRSSKKRDHIDPESDSFNEGKVRRRPQPKRKRKCKRMALDETQPPAPSLEGSKIHFLGGELAQKRKKIRTISAEMKLVRPGKRRRSNRERSLSSPMDLDDEERRSLSEASSEEDNDKHRLRKYQDEYDDEEEEDEEEFDEEDDDKGREADDEQSDWPGINEDLDDESNNSRRGYIEAKPDFGREIRAGTRRLRTQQEGFCIKSSSSEQLSRFLQDPMRTELKLIARQPCDRNQIVHLANLYSLNLRFEEFSVLLLTKTGNTVRVNNDELFLVPGTPSSPLDFKRRRKTPPPIYEPTNSSVFKKDCPPPASKRRSNCYTGSISS